LKLLVHELEAVALEQAIIPQKNTIVEAIRPHIYRHNFATGSLKLQIHNAADELVAESESINIADIATMDYFHGYVRFYINAYLKKDEEYTLSLVGEGGYTFAEGAYIGWVNGHDLAKYPISEAPASHYNYPLDYEIWERTER
jgi:hypothetical protein